ncbi:sensor histidine kinase [Streptomyces sp. HUAS TT7]|uniref:sensor histidine kinase n=1 Tax=Streptomyces sp. HUAS TT7 TaxID=3447507 RepID=UPI003F65AFD3
MSRQLETTWAPERLWTAAACGAALWAVWDSEAYAFNGLVLSGRPALAGAVGAAASLVLLWHARRPVLVASLAAVGHLLAYVPGALGLAMFATGTRVPDRRGLVVPVAAGTALALVGIRGGTPAPGLRENSVALALALGPLLAGYAIGRHHERSAADRRRMGELERERALWAERATAQERSRIARDMHDTLAHRLSGIVLTANALLSSPAALPGASSRAVERIRSDGRKALEELRETLGLLEPGGCAGRATAPADRIVTLVEEVRRDGTRAELHVDGHPEVLPEPVQLTAYRVVQESLTNVARYAPGAAIAVTLCCNPDGLRVEVTDTGARRPVEAVLPSGGSGLAGLAQRVAQLGGAFTAEPRGEGFTVRALLPHASARAVEEG